MSIVPMKQYLMEKIHGVLVIDFRNFSVDNSLSSHTNNQKNNFLVLGGNHDAPDKNFSINFSKAKTKFGLSLLYNGDNSYLFINRKTSIRLKQVIKKSTFFPNFF